MVKLGHGRFDLPPPHLISYSLSSEVLMGSLKLISFFCFPFVVLYISRTAGKPNYYCVVVYIFLLLILWALNPLKPEFNPISYLLALIVHHFLHVSRIRVKLLTFRLLMSYIYGAPILDVSRSHTTTQHSR